MSLGYLWVPHSFFMQTYYFKYVVLKKSRNHYVFSDQPCTVPLTIKNHSKKQAFWLKSINDAYYYKLFYVVIHSRTLRIPTTTTYRIINHLMFIDTNICSNWSNYIIRSETEQYNSSLRNSLIISRTMISLKNTSIRNSNFTIMLYSLLWRVVA